MDGEEVKKTIPEHSFRCRFEHKSIFIWKDITTDMMFKDKKIVIFGLPGAFTPTCSNEQLPQYEAQYERFKELGIDDVYCISVNDGFVMRSWGASMTPKIEKVFLCPDGDGKFTEQMGMLVDKPANKFGKRSWRYSAYVDNGEIKKMFIEPGKNDKSEDEDPFEVTDAETMLKYLRDNK